MKDYNDKNNGFDNQSSTDGPVENLNRLQIPSEHNMSFRSTNYHNQIGKLDMIYNFLLEGFKKQIEDIRLRSSKIFMHS